MTQSDLTEAGDSDADPDDGDGEDAPEYRLSHLMDEIAEAFSEHGMVQRVAPFERNGISQRVQNRVHFTVNGADGTGQSDADVEDVLETHGYAYIYNGDGDYYVLGREIADLRELREGDRVHVNNRRGPFKVYRARDTSPEELRRSGAVASVEVNNENTGTDWMIVQWRNEQHPWLYVKTTDTNSSVKGDYRFKKVEDVEWMGRIGPVRMYAPSHDHVSEGYAETVRDLLAPVREDESRGLDVHASAVDTTAALMASPASDVYAPDRANTVREVLDALADYYEQRADALTLETDDDRERAAENQELAEECRGLADAFNLARMDAIAEDGDTDIRRCEDCGKAWTNRFSYPKHCDLGCNGLDELYQAGTEPTSN